MWSEKAEQLRQLLESPAATRLESWGKLYRAGLELSQALAEKIDERLAEQRRELEREVAPDLVARLASDGNAVRAGLHSPDAAVRRLALDRAGEHPGLLTGERALLQSLAQFDPDGEVRRQAVFFLAREHQGSNDQSLLAIMAGLVTSETEPDDLRLDAYRALIYLLGKTDRWEPAVALLRFPVDVDWSLVARYLPPAAPPERSPS